MKKNDILELEIVDLASDGSGVGKVAEASESGEATEASGNGKVSDGPGQERGAMTFFVKDAIVGDKILAKITKLKKTYGYARMTELLEPSADRTEPVCPLHRKCGGCQIQTLSYQKQLEYKQNKICNALMRIGGFDASQIRMEPIIGMRETYRYRNKAQFPIGRDKNGKLAAGFYAARTHVIVPVDDCYLGVPQNRAVISQILEWMEQYQIGPYDESSGTGLIRHVLIRYGFHSRQLLVCVVMNGKSLPHEKELVDRLAALEGMTSISINMNERRSNVIMGDVVKTIWGTDYIEDMIGDIRYQISPLSFYQVNPVQTEVLYGKVSEFAGLSGKEVVWDLYCGIGTISLFLARKAKKVYGIEIVPQAVEDARRNAKLNGICNAEFFTGKAEDVWESLCGNGETERDSFNGENEKWRPQVVVVDPPRKGCGEKLLEVILRVQPERVVYVSCNPATLARDLKVLCAGGYEMVRGQGVDLFCQTVHVETVVQLSQRKPDDVIEVDLDIEELDITASEKKPTYQKIKQYVLEHTGLKVSSLYVAQVKQKCGLDMRLNYNQPKSENAKQPVCPKEKEDAIMDALKYFNMI